MGEQKHKWIYSTGGRLRLTETYHGESTQSVPCSYRLPTPLLPGLRSVFAAIQGRHRTRPGACGECFRFRIFTFVWVISING